MRNTIVGFPAALLIITFLFGLFVPAAFFDVAAAFAASSAG